MIYFCSSLHPFLFSLIISLYNSPSLILSLYTPPSLPLFPFLSLSLSLLLFLSLSAKNFVEGQKSFGDKEKKLLMPQKISWILFNSGKSLKKVAFFEG